RHHEHPAEPDRQTDELAASGDGHGVRARRRPRRGHRVVGHARGALPPPRARQADARRRPLKRPAQPTEENSMSSHREAPEISKDPVADNADTYAFVSPDKTDTVTIITNYVPLQAPPGGPNFFEFGDDVLYSIHIDNDGDAKPEITYEFRFQTQLRNPNTFLYNTGPITHLGDPNWNKRQFYSVTRVDHKKD